MLLRVLRTVSPLVALLAFACGSHSPELSTPQFDSASSVAIQANITDAIMITTDSQGRLADQIKDQLYFTVGYLNGMGGVADLANRTVTVKSVAPLAGSATLFQVTYDASFRIAWNRGYQVPGSIHIPVPAHGDYQGIQDFYTKYESSCVQDRHELSFGNFWYYYRPLMNGCPLAAQSGQEEFAYLLTITTARGTMNTQGKYPEYGKVWEDGKLVVTAVFGKYSSGTTDNDEGISAFNNMYRMLLQNFGRPSQSNINLRPREVPGVANPDVRLVFDTGRGPVDVNILLVDSLGGVSSAWNQHFNERTAISDLVAYSGHSGLGSNIRNFTRMGQFTPGQYQLYYINGCDTFAYVGNELAEAHHMANPTSAPSRYVDIITNSMPSPFDSMASSTDNIVVALFNQQNTYRQILSNINSGQNPNVTGEEDNRWPQPFDSVP